MRAMAPGKIVIDKEPGSTPSLDPSVVEPSQCREGCVRPAALKHNGKCGERLLKLGRSKEAFIPGKPWIEIVHEVLRENMRVSRRQ